MLPDRRVLWDHIVRLYGDASELAVDDLEKSLKAEGYDADRWSVIALLREFQQLNLGLFYVGRRQYKSRINWRKTPREMDYPWDAQPSLPATPGTRILELEIPVRVHVSVTISVPADLSRSEANRIIDFIRLLPLEQPGERDVGTPGHPVGSGLTMEHSVSSRRDLSK